MLGLIVAVNNNNVIGDNGTIPWKIKGEQRRFKELTTDNIVIMGRKTYDSIGKPLPNRINIVVTRSPENFTGTADAVVSSLEEALEVSKGYEKEGKNAYIIGGAMLYKEALPYVDRVHITKIDNDAKGDTFFPELTDLEFPIESVEVEILDGVRCEFQQRGHVKDLEKTEEDIEK